MKALKCITLSNNRTIGMMTDTVVRIEAVRYGLLEFATLVVHNTQGMDALLLIPSTMHDPVGEKVFLLCLLA